MGYPQAGLSFPGSQNTGTGRRLTVTLVLVLIFFAVLGGFLYHVVHGLSERVKHSSNDFAAALVANDPGKAPHEAAKFVPKVHAFYGHVSTATVVSRENECGNCGSRSGGGNSHWLVDILLRTHKGPVLLRLVYGPANSKIDEVIELAPRYIPKKDLDAADKAALAKAYVTRRIGCLRAAGDDTGDRIDCTQDDLEFRDLPTKDAAEAKVRSHTAAPKLKVSDDPVIKCLKRAHHDVKKLQSCATKAG
jgi:hypothetical protein